MIECNISEPIENVSSISSPYSSSKSLVSDRGHSSSLHESSSQHADELETHDSDSSLKPVSDNTRTL